MSISREQFEKGLEAFHTLVRSDPSMREEFERSHGEYFGARAPSMDPGPASEAARRRHLEWFLFERLGEHEGVLPVEHLLELWRERAGGALEAHLETFLQSHAGIFEVVADEGGDGVLVRDVAGLGEYRLDEPEVAAVVQPGDLVVGRLFPAGEARYRVSSGAGCFRDARLRAAIERDLQRLRDSRPHPVMRLSQVELERRFWSGPRPVGGGADPVGDLVRFLGEGGVAPATIASWREVLRRAPFDDGSIVPAVEGPLPEILDAIAFETELDLDRARALFLAAWHRLSGPDRSMEPDAPRPEEEVARAIARFDADRARGVDVESSFRELEQRLGLDDEEEPDELEAPDFPGVVPAMIEEFLWETELEAGSATAARYEGLRIFGGYTREIGVFENLGPREFLTFAAFWIPESRRLRSGAEAERLIEGLTRFGRWARETHWLEALDAELSARLEGLRASLPRVVVANALLPVERANPGELFELVGSTAAGRARLRDRAGEEREVPLESRLVALLRSGDLLRGYPRDDGAFVVGCCYPPEAIALEAKET